MVTASDFITLNYTPDLTQAGILYACRSLPYTYDRMGGTRFDRLRRIVAGVAVEVALRRHLTALEVPFDVLGATPFTQPDRYDLALGGRRCDLKSFLVFDRQRIRQIRQDPGLLLEAQALVPSDQLSSGRMGSEDVYIFAVLTALITPGRAALDRALAAGQPVHILYPMPEAWARPLNWSSLGSLALKCDTDEPLHLTLYGQDAQRTFQNEELRVPPRQRLQVRKNFYALSYLQATIPPDGLVGVHSPALDDTHLAPPTGWGNVWVYGLEILLLGYLTGGEFRRRARRLPAGSPALLYPQTRVENRVVPVYDLRPLTDLFVRARNWSHQRR